MMTSANSTSAIRVASSGLQRAREEHGQNRIVQGERKFESPDDEPLHRLHKNMHREKEDSDEESYENASLFSVIFDQKHPALRPDFASAHTWWAQFVCALEGQLTARTTGRLLCNRPQGTPLRWPASSWILSSDLCGPKREATSTTAGLREHSAETRDVKAQRDAATRLWNIQPCSSPPHGQIAIITSAVRRVRSYSSESHESVKSS
eukprot:3960713-Prymnesium_polylepis.2